LSGKKTFQPHPAIANSQWVIATERQQQERLHELLFKRKKSSKKKRKDTSLQALSQSPLLFPIDYGINTAQPYSPFLYSVSFWKKFAATLPVYFLFFPFFF